jgi:predicted DNA repair protein MutK
LLSAFAPFLIPPILMLGGSYLAYEATEKILEKLTGDHHDERELLEADTPAELEARQVAGAIRTDFILSAEIMVIALAELSMESLAMQSGALVVVAIGITIAVYGVVALIVKLDDIGLHMIERRSAAARSIGNGLVHGVPYLLTGLSGLGTAAMLWVGGGIILHGMEELHFEAIPHAAYEGAHSVAAAIGVMVPVVEWLANAIAASIAGLMVGAVIVGALRLRPKRQQPAEGAACPEEIV